jgi:hypothetical protein
MRPVEITDNRDGTWTARIYNQSFTGTYEQCANWLRWNGESA